MANVVLISPAVAVKKSGIEFWMIRALKECRRARRKFTPETVHDLRVALRRCRSIAGGMFELDADPAWAKLKKASRKLFRALGALRDAQVLTEWVPKLCPEEDPVRAQILTILGQREHEARATARQALNGFDQKNWRHLAKQLDKRTQGFALDGPVFQSVAIRRWTEAYALDERARQRRSRVAWHRLRIALKKFRYTVENFLPQRHELWGDGLKRAQDLLGAVHDLDLLQQLLREVAPHVPAPDLERSKRAITAERSNRLAEYRQLTAGDASLWRVWQQGLAPGPRSMERPA